MRITFHNINGANHAAQEKKEYAVSRALRVLEDPDRAKRIEVCQCPACFYLDNMLLAGQAFTEWSCDCCELPQPSWHNTATPKICRACAVKFNLCVRCRADLDLRPRRKVVVRRSSRSR